MKKIKRLLILLAWVMSFTIYSQADNNETKRELQNLPEILISINGKEIKNSTDWEQIRRPEIVELFEMQMYGKVPDKPIETIFKVTKNVVSAQEGKAELKEIEISLFNL